MKYEFVYKGFIIQMSVGEEIQIPDTNETLKLVAEFDKKLLLQCIRGIYSIPFMYSDYKVVEETSEAPWSGGIAENH